MRPRMHGSAMAVGVALLVAAPGASATTAKSCGDAKPSGITSVKATGVTCASGLKVARNYNVSSLDKAVLNGWSCKGKRVSSTRESVTCRKGARKLTFRSTYQVELPPAAAPPIVNG